MSWLKRHGLVIILPLSLCALAYVNFFVVMENDFDPRYLPMPFIIGIVLALGIQEIRQQRTRLAENSKKLKKTNRDLKRRQIQNESALQKLQTTQTSALVALGAVHDIRNLLTPILGNNQLPASQTKPPSELLAVASSAAQRCIELSNKVLSGIQQTDFSPTKLRFDHVVRESANDVHALLLRDFELTIDLQPSMIMFDKDDLTQILYNLVNNAVQAKPKDLTINISGTSDDSGQYTLDITDNGPGVPDHIIDFDPDNSIHTVDGEIHGLGLTLVHRLVLRNQGQLVIRKLKVGSLFRLQLPIDLKATEAIKRYLSDSTKAKGSNLVKINHEEEPTSTKLDISASIPLPEDNQSEPINATNHASAMTSEQETTPDTASRPTKKTAQEASESSRPTILIVDDNEVNCQVLEAFLGTENVITQTATSGFEAIEMAEETHYDVILMDIEMPVLDGMSTIESIQNQSSLNAETPIVAITAHDESRIRNQNSNLKIEGYLAKPVDREKLYSSIRQLLKEH